MTEYLLIELFELLCALGYLLGTSRQEEHLTQHLFLGMSMMLFYDIFFLRGEKPLVIWGMMNIPFLIFCYEKIFRKLVINLYKRVVVDVLFRRDL